MVRHPDNFFVRHKKNKNKISRFWGRYLPNPYFPKVEYAKQRVMQVIQEEREKLAGGGMGR